MNKTGLAVIGLGSIARKAHLPVLTAHPAVEIIGLCSRTGNRVDELAAQYRLNLTARTFDEILAAKPAAAVLLSATEAHPGQAIRLLEAGIAVLMEKPLALELPGARAIVSAAERPGAPLLMVAFNRRYAPAYRRAKALFAESGRAPELIQVSKHRGADHSGWALRQVIMDDFIHVVDTARFFTPDGELNLQAATCRPGLTAAALRSPAGAIGHISQTFGAGGPTERVELHGGGLSVIVEEMERLTIREGGETRVETIGGSWTGTLEKRGIAGEIEQFLACLRTGATPETTAREALRTQELAEAILLRGDA